MREHAEEERRHAMRRSVDKLIAHEARTLATTETAKRRVVVVMGRLAAMLLGEGEEPAAAATRFLRALQDWQDASGEAQRAEDLLSHRATPPTPAEKERVHALRRVANEKLALAVRALE